MQRIRPMLSRLFRCHPATWFVVLAAGALGVLLMVPGEIWSGTYRQRPSGWDQQCQLVYDQTKQLIADDANAKLDASNDPYVYQQSFFPLVPRVYEHGWPRPCVARSVEAPLLGGFYSVRSRPALVLGRPVTHCTGELLNYVSWSNYDNWPIESKVWKVHAGNLAIDGLVAFSLLGSLGWLSEWWLRSRGGLLRFRILDLLTAVTLCGLALAWVQHHVRLRANDEQVKAYFEQLPAATSRSVNAPVRYQGPAWLRKLAGHDSYVPLGHYIYSASLTPGPNWREDFDQLAKLTYLEKGDFRHGLPLDAIESLSRCRWLETLLLNVAIEPKPPALASGQSTNALPADIRLLRAEDLADLGQLHLKHVHLWGANILAEDVVRLLEVTELDFLDLQDASVTLQDLNILRKRFPQTNIAALWGIGKQTPPEGHNAAVAQLQQERKTP